MTTIATDGKTIAADGLRTWGDQVRGRDHQKIRVHPHAIYAFTGLAPMLDVMVEWHMDGADPKELPAGVDHKTESWTLVVVNHDGIGKLTSTCPYMERFDPPIAFGAGGEYAMGAMLAGASPQRAVELVGGLTNHTGGTVQVVDIAEVLAS